MLCPRTTPSPPIPPPSQETPDTARLQAAAAKPFPAFLKGEKLSPALQHIVLYGIADAQEDQQAFFFLNESY